MKLLLINPKFPESFWSFSWALNHVAKDKETINSPLGLATLAALSPQDWEIEILDENVEPIDWNAQADIVGVCGMGVQVKRQKEILKHFRSRGFYTVAGGSYASLCPEEYAGDANTVVAGESEQIWPKFCADFLKGTPQPLYQETNEVDLTTSPTPRFDLLKLNKYQKVSLQFSRGCPYRCEFCDIIVMFGRKPRTKAVEQIGRELDVLRENGVVSAFFVDDNLIGHGPKAKELLQFLVDYQKKHHYRFSFGTEASLNMAGDPTLMRLFRAANFEWVFIGIETPSTESLKETGKTQNLRQDLLTSIRTIYSYGIDIFAGFIVGFDSDDKTIFDRQYDFILNSGISMAMVGLLTALPKTPLYERLEKAGRLQKDISNTDNTRPTTNVIPLRMSYEELVSGYQRLHSRLLENRTVYKKLVKKLRFMKNPLQPAHLSLQKRVQYFGRFLFHGIFKGGFSRSYYFTRSLLLAFRWPKALTIVINDWVASLSLRNFIERNCDYSLSRTEEVLQRLKGRLAQHREVMAARLALLQDRAHIWIDFKNHFDRESRQALVESLQKTLKQSREAVVLDFRHLKSSSSVQVGTLLRKLKGRRHQVHIYLTEELYSQLQEVMGSFQYTLVTA